jgi:hypothetical protein
VDKVMVVEDIKSEEDVLEYIQGCLYDYRDGEVSQNDTEWAMINLIIYLVKKDRENQLFNETSGSGLKPK